jgi:hypothetical protein
MYYIWGMLNDLTLLMSLSMVGVYVPGLPKQIQNIIL